MSRTFLLGTPVTGFARVPLVVAGNNIQVGKPVKVIGADLECTFLRLEGETQFRPANEVGFPPNSQACRLLREQCFNA